MGWCQLTQDTQEREIVTESVKNGIKLIQTTFLKKKDFIIQEMFHVASPARVFSQILFCYLALRYQQGDSFMESQECEDQYQFRSSSQINLFLSYLFIFMAQALPSQQGTTNRKHQQL